MSQPICPDCGLLAMRTPSSCELCGWNGDPRPRKIMYLEDFRRRSLDTTKALKLKKEGTLHFVKIYFAKETSIEIYEKITYFIEKNELSWNITQQNRTKYVCRATGEKPNAKIIAKLSEFKTIKNVEVY